MKVISKTRSPNSKRVETFTVEISLKEMIKFFVYEKGAAESVQVGEEIELDPEFVAYEFNRAAAGSSRGGVRIQEVG